MHERNIGDADQVRVALLFHSLTSGNLGVGALTVANMAIVARAAEEAGVSPRFVCMGMRDGETPPIMGDHVESYPLDTRRLLSPGGYYREIGRADCALDIGAGDSFTDIYARKRFVFLWMTKALALLRGVPLILSPQTIGPFDQPRNQKIAGALMRRARLTVARDEKSLAVARELAPGANLALAVDVAFELPYESRATERGGARIRVGVNASGLLFTEAEKGTNRFGLEVDYADYTRRLIAALLARGDVDVFLVTHAYSTNDPGDDDSHRADLLAAEFPGVTRVPDFADPSAVKTFISSLDFLVAGRMHACIGAYSSETPVVPIAYSRKFSGLFGMLGYEWMVPVKGMDTDRALAFTLDALDRRGEMAADAGKGMTQVQGKLAVYREALVALFREIKAARRK